MADQTTTVEELRQVVARFVRARDWEQFHTPKNLSMSMAIEAAELMEHFQWLTGEASLQVVTSDEKMSDIRDELADVLCYALALSNSLGIDISDAVANKMEKNASKYPADRFHGRYGADDQR